MYNSYCCPLSKMVLRIHGKDESVVRFRQGAPYVNPAGNEPNFRLYL